MTSRASGESTFWSLSIEASRLLMFFSQDYPCLLPHGKFSCLPLVQFAVSHVRFCPVLVWFII